MSTLSDYGIPGVGSGIMAPKHTNRWRVTFANMGGGVSSSPVSMQAVKVNRPTLTFKEIELHRYVTQAYVAGKYSWSDMSLTIEDDVTSTATTVIQAQLQKQQWIIGAEGQWLAAAPEGSLYKFVTYLDMLDGNDQPIEKWIVEGCWIKEANYGDLDYSASEAATIALTIRFDHARQNILPYSAGPGSALGGPGLVL